jgi:hypothetical protein
MEEEIYCKERGRMVTLRNCQECPYLKGCKDLKKYYKEGGK